MQQFRSRAQVTTTSFAHPAPHPVLTHACIVDAPPQQQRGVSPTSCTARRAVLAELLTCARGIGGALPAAGASPPPYVRGPHFLQPSSARHFARAGLLSRTAAGGAAGRGARSLLKVRLGCDSLGTPQAPCSRRGRMCNPRRGVASLTLRAWRLSPPGRCIGWALQWRRANSPCCTPPGRARAGGGGARAARSCPTPGCCARGALVRAYPGCRPLLAASSA